MISILAIVIAGVTVLWWGLRKQAPPKLYEAADPGKISQATATKLIWGSIMRATRDR